MCHFSCCICFLIKTVLQQCRGHSTKFSILGGAAAQNCHANGQVWRLFEFHGYCLSVFIIWTANGSTVTSLKSVRASTATRMKHLFRACIPTLLIFSKKRANSQSTVTWIAFERKSVELPKMNSKIATINTDRRRYESDLSICKKWRCEACLSLQHRDKLCFNQHKAPVSVFFPAEHLEKCIEKCYQR